MEIGEAVLPLDFVDPQFDFAERMVFVLLQVRKRNFEYPSFQSIVRILQTRCPVYQRFADAFSKIQFRGL